MTHRDIHPRARTGALLLLAAGSLLLAGCNRDGEADAAEAPAPITVGVENVVVVREDTLQTGPRVSGTLAAERTAQVRAEVAGSVLQVHAEAGQRVARGSVLAEIDDAAVRALTLSARSAMTSAENVVVDARREAERSTTLLQAGAIAERDAEAAQRGLVAAEAQLAGARAQLAAAQRQLDATRARAPFAGVVSERQVNAGDVVAPGAALFTIVDPSSMRYEASVPAEQLADVRVGAPVTFTVSGYQARTFEGRITRVNPVADPSTRQVRLLVSVPNTGNQLVGGLFAEGRVASERVVALVAPFSAVDQRGVTPQVFRLRNGIVEQVAVQLGLRDEQTERVQLTSGVAAGDTLLTGAAQGITPGSAVRVSQPGDAAQPARPVANR